MYLTRLPSGKWRAVYRAPDGRRRSITRPTKTEVKAEAGELEAQIRKGAWHDPTLGRVTFADWTEQWKAGRVVEEATQRKNDSHLKVHVLPRWKAVRIGGITHSDVQAWVADMTRGKVGAETVRQAHALFSTILERAHRNGMIRANPARGVELPTVAKQPERFLSGAEVQAIVGCLDGQDARIVTLASETGMRWSELTGMHVKRLDLSNRLLHVVEVAVRSGHVKPYPKSKNSFRTLPLTDKLVTMLEVQVAGKHGEDLVFQADPAAARSDAESILMLDYTNWRRRVWLPAVKESGVRAPLPTFHDLRHSYASRLIAGGADVLTVQSKMGHDSLLTTQKYSHAAPGANERVRAILEALDSPVTHEH